MKRKSPSSDEEEYETPTIRKQIEKTIRLSHYSESEQNALLSYIETLLKIFGKNKESEMSQNAEKTIALVIYVACLRCKVVPPYNDPVFSKRIFQLQRSKNIQKYLDELMLKKEHLEPHETVDSVYKKIFNRGRNVVKFIDTTFHTYMNEGQNALIPKHVFYVINVIWSYISYQLASNVMKAAYDGRNTPSTISILCRLIHDCVEVSTYKRFVSDNSSLALDQLLDIIAGGKSSLYSQAKQFVFSNETIPGYAHLVLLLNATVTIPPSQWITMADKYKNNDGIEEYMNTHFSNIVKKETKQKGKTLAFKATPITTITIGNSWGF
jgi:hypothetical protein